MEKTEFKLASKAYSEIFELLNKYKDICSFDIGSLQRDAEHHLYGIELKEKYGLNINPKSISSSDYVALKEHICICRFGEKYSRTVSWSDDGTQPKDEMLLKIGFPTGAYIFGDDYPQDLFHKFWDELKAYNPKFTDTNNSALYFSMENAAKVFNEFDSILKRYNEINQKDFKQRQIKRMEEELNKLKNN